MSLLIHSLVTCFLGERIGNMQESRILYTVSYFRSVALVRTVYLLQIHIRTGN